MAEMNLFAMPTIRAMATAILESEPLVEYTSNAGNSLTVDREKGIIRGVKLLGLESRNRRSFRPEALKQSITLFEGARSNVNHSPKGAAAPRDYGDRLGIVRSVTYREGQGLYGDFHYNPKHALAEQLIWDAENSPGSVGFSPAYDGRVVADRNGRNFVESITRVFSVDLVADPATTNGLFESIENPIKESAMSTLAEMTVEQIFAARPELKTAALTEARESQESKDREAQFALLEAENKTLKAEKTARERKAAVDLKLTESKLPETVLTESIKNVAYGMDDAGLAGFIESLQGIAKGMPKGQKPKSDEQESGRSMTESLEDPAPINPKAVAAKYR